VSPEVKTQHSLGSVVFEQEEDDSVLGICQAQGLSRRVISNGTVAWWNAYNDLGHCYRCNGQGAWSMDGLKSGKQPFIDGGSQDVIGRF